MAIITPCRARALPGERRLQRRLSPGLCGQLSELAVSYDEVCADLVVKPRSRRSRRLGNDAMDIRVELVKRVLQRRVVAHPRPVSRMRQTCKVTTRMPRAPRTERLRSRLNAATSTSKTGRARKHSLETDPAAIARARPSRDGQIRQAGGDSLPLHLPSDPMKGKVIVIR